MPYKNILAAYDKSEPATRAVKCAAEMAAQNPGCSLRVISVLPTMVDTLGFGGTSGDIAGSTGMSFDGELLGQLQEDARVRVGKEMSESLDKVIKLLGDRCTMETAFGASPATAILEYAEDHECDLIVMGCRGLGALRSALGSVSFSVVRSSQVNVMIVK